MNGVEQANQLLHKMWADYIKVNPQAQKIFNLLSQNGETVENDHIALRTFNHPQLGIKSLAAPFLKQGFALAGDYFFSEKKLYAQHFQHPDPRLPKIFISELELEKVSPYIQEIVANCIYQIDEKSIQDEHFSLSGRHWNINYSTYQKLAAESEYASWVYAFGFRPNHFTVSVNKLKHLTELHRLNSYLKDQGIRLNSSGGEIKGTPAELLEQSSTMANEIQWQFSDGVYSIPACYYEFAKRYSMNTGELYQGFIAKSADKIFESTNRA
ncbi:MAG: succinyldiaminopimelate aminotransferase [Bdellovibrionales bacterium RIFCSPHIGHO2_01_FULL_40_29]|nr:MAG: succinyldiaminopimelate aminotransferase [Bdellovibrionales bacterium RIFCSPHIGHO2_01_FULL_40_29]OFZ32664.1 MAG: succinyldiaminopimelate aminotransferase [Bdellovibrionales bacterium RIFCSPHIGHO2_02_FULL_40_15]